MSFLGKLFNSDKKDTTYTGPRPISTLQQVQGGPQYYQTIQDRLAGRGTGYGDTYASKYANPIVNNMRSTFSDYQLPELKSELSVSGRRGATGGNDLIRRAYGDEANQEGDIFSRLQQRNEDASRADVNDAFGKLGNYTDNEANLFNNFVNFDKGLNDDQVAQANQRRANQATGYQNLVNAAGDAVSTIYGGGSGTFQRQAPQYNTLSSNGNPNVGFGNSGNSLNQRLAQRNALSGRIR